MNRFRQGANPEEDFKKWLNYVSGAYFLANGNHVISRDYMSVKLWDIRHSTGMHHSKPVYSAQVTEYMEKNLTKLYEQDSLDDEFFLSLSPDSKHIVTGAYNKSAHVIDTNATTNQIVRCRFDAQTGSSAARLKVYNKEKRLSDPTALKNISSGTTTPVYNGTGANNREKPVAMDCRKQVTLGAWSPLLKATKSSPDTHTLVLAYRNCLYLYSGSTSNSNQKSRHPAD